MIDYAWGHAVISDELYAEINSNCNFSNYNRTSSCDIALNKYFEVYNLIDMYSLYTPTCFNSTVTSKPIPLARNNHEIWNKRASGYDPCVEYYTDIYFNQRDVQKALHANVSGSIAYNWTHCSDVIKVWNDSPFTILPTIKTP
ncbi:hypothetical protein ZOSMA_209G00030 [Zostera marina]|uniref:Uncharacterized protein n=1 Tax=Zostera marina TaxID=29655 RepID=A0A0K9PN84_ZOSMR|nr:hypothetical protein ZOSMA_209G00030 [Zostera marina]